MKMMKYAAVVAAVSVAGLVQANMLNGTFTDHNLNSHTANLTDTGWGAKTFWKAGPTAGTLETQALSWGPGARSFGVVQTLSVGANTGNALRLSFDWTSSATATNPASKILTYQLFGFDTGGTVVNGSEVLAHGLNFFGTTVGTVASTTLPAGSVTYDFIGGSWGTTNGGSGGLFIHPGSGQGYASAPNVVTANFGDTVSVDQTFSVLLNGQTDLADYDYIGVRFIVGDNNNNITATNGDLNNGGALIENISLTAIPEPATLGLIASFGGAVLFIRRRFMM